MSWDVFFSGWLRVYWRRWQWWWWKWHWLRMVVVVVVWGGAVLAMCRYWRVPLLSHTYHGSRDPFHISHSYNDQGFGYTGSQGLSSDRVQRHPEHMNGLEPGKEYHGRYVTIQQKLNQHPDDVSYKHSVKSFKPINVIKPHIYSLGYNNSLHSQDIKFDYPDSNSISANESFIGKEVRSRSLKDNHKTYIKDRYYVIDNTVPNKSTQSRNVSNGAKEEGHRENQTFMTNKRSNNVSKIDENIKQNKDPPRVILLLTTWRSGSTFLGELLATAVPETFYR